MNKEINTLVNQYPNDFFDFGSGKKLSDEEIKDMLKRCFKMIMKRMKKSKKHVFACNSTGDSLVIVNGYRKSKEPDLRYDIEVWVCKNYSEGSLIDFGPNS
jgi:hypothetical protein